MDVREVSRMCSEVIKKGFFITCDKCGRQNFVLPEKVYGKYYECQYCNKEIEKIGSIFRELLHKAGLDIKNSSFREVVFNCYSALEVFLSETGRWILELQDVPKEIVNYIFKKRISVEGYVELLNNYMSDKLNYDREIKSITVLRNDVVHRGYKPKPTETIDCFKRVSDLILKVWENIELSFKKKAIKKVSQKRQFLPKNKN